MPASSIYLKHELTIKDLSARTGRESGLNLANKWYFVGVDIAPIDNLETGVAVLDRNRRIVRMDKFDDDKSILRFLDNLAAPGQLAVALDIPKSLSIPSKWRQQQVKMHPLSLREPLVSEVETVPTARFAQRAKDFYEAVQSRDILIFGFFTAHARLRYDLTTPFRHRSPAGCRALQAMMRQRLGIRDVPSNLAPSSVLDAMIGAYSAWLLRNGVENEHFKLYEDDERRLYFDPLKRVRQLKAR